MGLLLFELLLEPFNWKNLLKVDPMSSLVDSVFLVNIIVL